jgi:hypothetical protein
VPVIKSYRASASCAEVAHRGHHGEGDDTATSTTTQPCYPIDKAKIRPCYPSTARSGKHQPRRHQHGSNAAPQGQSVPRRSGHARSCCENHLEPSRVVASHAAQAALREPGCPSCAEQSLCVVRWDIMVHFVLCARSCFADIIVASHVGKVVCVSMLSKLCRVNKLFGMD